MFASDTLAAGALNCIISGPLINAHEQAVKHQNLTDLIKRGASINHIRTYNEYQTTVSRRLRSSEGGSPTKEGL